MRALFILLSLLLSGFSSHCSAGGATTTSVLARVQGDYVSIRTMLPEPLRIGVITPSRGTMFVLDDEITCGGFKVLKDGLELSLVGLMGVSDGKRTIGRVFERAGNYTIVIADNLETEWQNSAPTTVDLVYSGGDEVASTEMCDIRGE